ncbi:MAG: NAD(P)H-quinone oxidoreductase [Caulobacterales bacterium]
MAEMMRAVHHEKDKPLRLAETPVPKPGKDQVLIKVAAAGVNRPDLVQRLGGYPPPPGWPETLGLEVSGVIADANSASRWKNGDRVCALLGGGGYAEYAIADAGCVLPIPDGLSFEEAAGVPETSFTVWANVFETCALKPGETFLVHGGASGIGTTAIQMAKAHGARVFATAGTAEKTTLCEKLGAERGINYKSEDFEAILREAGGGDVILDMVGGPYLSKNLGLLKQNGRMSIIATLQGAKGEIDLARVMVKRLMVTGSTLRARPVAEKSRIAAAVEQVVWPWLAHGAFKPLIDSVFPLDQAEDALARMTADLHAGKIILKT